MNVRDAVLQKFRDRFGVPPSVLARAPGRARQHARRDAETVAELL